MIQTMDGSGSDWPAFLNRSYEKFVELIKRGLDSRGIPEEAREWILACINYNLPGGKQNRACAFLHSFHILSTCKSNNQSTPNNTESEVFLACVAWGVELLQAFFLIADDLMDHAVMRRGKVCWHRDPAIGLTALNDVLLLQTTLYCLLDDLILENNNAIEADRILLSYRVQKLFQEVTLKTEVGQYFDLRTLPPNQSTVDLNVYSWTRVSEIARLKTAYYSFYLPVALACLLTAQADLLEGAEEALLPLGVFFQAQDDYLDVYGDPAKIGKVGTDVEEGKCSWLILKALELADEEQREAIARNYGQRDPSAINAIKELFKQLSLEQHFLEYEEEFKTQYYSRPVNPRLKPIVDFFASKIFHRQS